MGWQCRRRWCAPCTTTIRCSTSQLHKHKKARLINCENKKNEQQNHLHSIKQYLFHTQGQTGAVCRGTWPPLLSSSWAVTTTMETRARVLCFHFKHDETFFFFFSLDMSTHTPNLHTVPTQCALRVALLSRLFFVCTLCARTTTIVIATS